MNRTTCPNLVRSCPVDTDGLNRTDKPSLLEGCPVSGVRSGQREKGGQRRKGEEQETTLNPLPPIAARDSRVAWHVWRAERDDLPRRDPRLRGDEEGTPPCREDIVSPNATTISNLKPVTVRERFCASEKVT
jgi:hypothetical protein